MSQSHPRSLHPWLENVMPFATSLSVHIAIVLIGIATVTTIRNLPSSRPSAISTSDFVIHGGTEDLRQASLSFAGPNNNPRERFGIESAIEEVVDPALVKQSTRTLNDVLAGGGGDENAMIGLGAGSTMFPSGPGRGLGTGDGTGDGSGRIGIGLPTGGDKSQIFRTSSQARSIVFVCDASGSMMGKMGILKVELQKAISGLRPTQAFNVAFFQEGRPSVLSEKLLLASPANQRRAFDFLEDITSSGSTEPMAGLEIAFKQSPQMIVLLTDGDFSDNAAVLARIRELNKGRAVQVNTVAFTNRADTDTGFLKVLQTIANENRGSFRHVREEEMR